MRRSGLAAVITGALLVVACSDQPTAPVERSTPPEAGPAFTAVCTTSDETCIQNLINALFPKGDLLKSANDFWNNIKTKVRQGGTKGLPQAQGKATDLVNFGLKNFYADKLIGQMSQNTQDNLIALAAAVYQYTSMPNAPTLSEGALDPDGAAAIITPESPTTLVITGTKQAGILIPAGAAPTTTLVSIVRLPDSPGPLRTSLDQFPLFYHFASSPEVTFNVDVTGGICQSQTFDAETFAQLRLAHNVFPFGFGDVEILPRVDAPFLDCSGLAEPVGTLERGGLIGFASAGWSFFGRTVGPVATAILLPDELHAAVLETCCLGGTLKKFSEFGAVDPGSNPASLDYNPDAATFDDLSAPAGTAVIPAPSVVVKSANRTPIANVPVVFEVGEGGGTVNGGSTATVNTNASGIATVTTWTVGIIAGTYSLTATPPAVAQVGAPPPAFKPEAQFSPLSLQFTATATAGPAATIAIQDGDAQTAPAGGTVAIPPAVRVTDQYGNVVSGFTVIFSVTGGGGSITGATAVTDAGGIAAVGSWTLGVGSNTLDATAAGLSGSPVTFTATGTPEDHLLINFDIAPDESAVASGTVVNTLYASQGVTFQKAGTGLCGPDVYASANQPAGFGSTPNVVSLCAPPIASDISENTFGLIQADFATAAFGVCIDVAPPSPTGFARLDAFDAGGTLIGSASSAAGAIQTLCFTGTGIRRVRFSGDGAHFARFDNLQVDFVAVILE